LRAFCFFYFCIFVHTGPDTVEESGIIPFPHGEGFIELL